MNEPTLQTILREKYSIGDRMFAEGRFVGLIGDHAASLVCLGLGIRCFVLAKVVLSGDVIDYDLISIIPLSALSLSYQNNAKKIKVTSQFKSTQVFQLCTSENQAEVWDNFTSTIREVYMPERGDIWCSATLHPIKSSSRSPNSSSTDSTWTDLSYTKSKRRRVAVGQRRGPRYAETSSTDCEQPSLSQSDHISEHSLCSTMSYRSICSLPKFDSRLSDSSVSLPPKLPSQIDENNNWFKSSRSYSVDLLDVQFESFVNEAPSERNNNTWVGSSNNSTNEYDEKFNVSNNFIENGNRCSTILQDENNSIEKSDGKLCKLLNRAWNCCTGRKKGT